jgi:hypothetical protein
MNENSIFNNLHHILVLLYVDDMLVTGSRLHYTKYLANFKITDLCIMKCIIAQTKVQFAAL